LQQQILVVGSLAYDDVETPFERRKAVLGGAASYFALAARLYAPVRLCGVVGDDFVQSDLERLASRGIDMAGVERRPGRSFRWLGRYNYELNTAETINTDLGVFARPASATATPFSSRTSIRASSSALWSRCGHRASPRSTR